jgi:catechol-2,3-dioxygenase
MSAKPKFAHVVYQTAQPQEMRDWYCTVLDGHVVYTDEALSFITFDDEHHRVALLHPPIPMLPKSPTTAAMHHTAYTFETIDDLLDRYEELRDNGIRPAVCVAHGVTTSMYYRDPDGNFVEMQIDRFAEPDDATAYMNGPEYAADSVGPAFDPDELLAARRAGATVEELSDRKWALQTERPPAIAVLLGVG